MLSADVAYLGEVKPLVDVAGAIGQESVALIEPSRPQVLFSDPELGGHTAWHDRIEQILAAP